MHTLIFDEGSLEEREKAQEELERCIRQRPTGFAIALFGRFGNMKIPCGHTDRAVRYLFKICRIYGIEIPEDIKKEYAVSEAYLNPSNSDGGTTWIFEPCEEYDG